MNQTNYKFCIYDELLVTLENRISKEKPIILAIDGMCGSGKTTLADYLTTKFCAQVIHMDNFFLPFERKTPVRLSEAGGNIDYERFIEVLLPALERKKPFSYTAYNCQTADFDRTITIDSCDLIIVEGSYSLHEKFGHYYDLSLFTTVSKEEQLRRLETRCKNDQKFQRFITEWIPMEQHYHNAQNIVSKCDMIIDTTFNYL